MRARTILVALLVVLLLIAVGCGGGSGKEDSGSSLTFWTAEDNPDRVKATQAIVNRFEQQTNIKVKLVAIGEDQLQSQLTSASAAGSLPDVLAAASLGFAHSLAADGIADPDAAAAVINTLGRSTFSQRGLSLVEANGKPVAVPSDSWTQLLVYRKDLFAKAGRPHHLRGDSGGGHHPHQRGNGGDRGRHQGGRVLHPADLRVLGRGQPLPAHQPGRRHHPDQQALSGHLPVLCRPHP
jgi:maltose-binding protein MalE